MYGIESEDPAVERPDGLCSNYPPPDGLQGTVHRCHDYAYRDAERFNNPVTVSIERDIPADATNVRFFCIDNGDTVYAQVNGSTVTGDLWHFSSWAIIYDLPADVMIIDGDDLPPTWHYVPQQTHHSSTTLIAATCAAAIAAIAIMLVALVVTRKN